MYGLVNKAIEKMVCSHFDEATWLKIKQKAEFDEPFVSMESYPDDVTHRLVKAASEILDLSPAEIMKAFGEYWVLFTAQEGYGDLMNMHGDNLPEFLENLDELHARVGVMFPKLQPPSFECEDLEGEDLEGEDLEGEDTGKAAMELHYYSSREGLAPMVLGLVKGLGQRFDTEVEVCHHQKREEGADHDTFTLKYQEK